MVPSPRKRQQRKASPSPATRPHPGAAKPASRKPARPADSSTRATRVLDWLLRKLSPRQREKALDYL
ncbi:MAG TPA: 4-hydroxybenzoate octaprenyltransferase, partial [Rhodanobacter sp.]